MCVAGEIPRSLRLRAFIPHERGERIQRASMPENARDSMLWVLVSGIGLGAVAGLIGGFLGTMRIVHPISGQRGETDTDRRISVLVDGRAERDAREWNGESKHARRS